MSRGHHHPKRGFQWSLWGGPIVVGIISVVGLTAGLMGDGLLDLVSWFGLGIPFALCLWFGLPRKHRHATTPTHTDLHKAGSSPTNS